MTTDSTQTDCTPKESLLESNNDKTFNMDQSLTTDTVIVSQQSIIQFNATNMIPSQIPSMPNRMQLISSHTTAQLGRRRRRRRQRQRRQQRQQRQRRRQQHERPQQGRPSELIRLPRYRRWSSSDSERRYWEEMGFPEFIEENLTPVLETYYWETMDPNERREAWEQNHLNELQRNTALDQQDSSDYLEAFAVLEHLQLIEDEIEQTHQIDSIKQLEAEELQRRYNAEQIQLPEWQQNPYEEYIIAEHSKLTYDEMEEL
ncbi:hypothetical protein I4U23_017142 [Adineta vaga]|nr:hypothetical protein I4U23_017142 [Adineta vaga]